jgi:hypothetical protein
MSILSNVPDQTLVERCLASDKHALEEFFAQCKTWFFEFIRNDLFHKGTPWDWLDEVTALALEALAADDYRRLRAFHPARAPLATYLAVIAREQFKLFLRNRYWQKEHESSLRDCAIRKMETRDDSLESEIEEIATILTPKEKSHYQECNLTIPSEQVLAADSPANRRKLDQRIRDKVRAYQEGTVAETNPRKGTRGSARGKKSPPKA